MLLKISIFVNEERAVSSNPSPAVRTSPKINEVFYMCPVHIFELFRLITGNDQPVYRKF